ncbi:nitroreductase (plasmid) [Mycobacterium branderi]|uniref:Nitroreductase n=1 Tax=Mycobacterium branderi TaxID=43348 RepID=A0ABN6BH15_9MYCO|nr:nitroreductase [Mycobacterium branderi]
MPRALLEECLELALQAPNAENRNEWRWIVVDDREMVTKLAAEYRAAMSAYQHSQPGKPAASHDVPGGDAIVASAYALAEKLDRMPAILIPLMPGRPEGKSLPEQCAMWGSIIQAVWSFFLALRERGLGSAWTTVASRREKQIAELLGIPHDQYTQVGLFPIAYTIGTDFKKVYRKPVSEVLSYNRF